MKNLKIAFGFLLLIGAGIEYNNASRELETFFSPGIFVGILIVLVISTWLISTGYKNKNIKILSFEYFKYFLISIMILGISAILNHSSENENNAFTTVDGIKIPLRDCINGNRRFIPDRKNREKYCACISKKIMSDDELRSNYQTQLENGKIVQVLKEIQSNDGINNLNIEECMTSIQIKWTGNIAKSMKQVWIKELRGSELEETNDIEKYCNCLITELQKLPLDRVKKNDFWDSEKSVEIISKCSTLSMK